MAELPDKPVSPESTLVDADDATAPVHAPAEAKKGASGPIPSLSPAQVWLCKETPNRSLPLSFEGLPRRVRAINGSTPIRRCVF